MSQARAFLSILRWDLAVELRRREAVLNMGLFALLLLFIGSYAFSGGNLARQAGPAFFWMAILFAGTIGLSRAFQVEREDAALAGMLASPLDPGVLYLAKVAAVWIYVMAMELLVLGAYTILFDFDRWRQLGILLGVMSAFTLAYVAPGTVLAAMTASLRGGEVLLRILLLPLMIPAIIVALEAGESIFAAGGSVRPAACIAALLAMAAVYLASGYLLFPKAVEE